MQSQRLEFDGKLFDAPIPAWIYAINEMLKQREAGKLKLPLSSHNYLFRIVSAYKAPADVVETPPGADNKQMAPISQMEVGVSALQAMKRGG